MIDVQYLRITEHYVIDDFRFMRGVHYRLSWLRDRYKELVHQGMSEAAARVYMLHLV